MLDWNDLLLTQPSALDSESTQQAYQDCTTISRTRFWPVVDHGRYTGLMGPDGHVLSAPSLKVEQHPLDALAIASAWQVDCVAVCNKEVFEGVYVTASLAERIGQQWSFQLPGSSIWFEHPVDQPFSGTWIRGIEA
ncbi:MAG TPA: hypothetical protein DCL07_00390, partial [Cryomorphaceae bacterium]|nr:hypothetical protein [Cryomorphaceae bacterium]